MSETQGREFQVDTYEAPQASDPIKDHPQSEGYRAEQGEQSESEPQVEVEVEDSQQEEAPKKRYRDPAKARINAILREKYSIEEQARALQEENERLRRLAQFTTETASRQFEDNINQRLEKAKQMKAQAIESGDVKAQVDADVELTSAMSDWKSHNSWVTQEQIKAQEAQQVQQAQMQQQQRQPYQQASDVVNREQAMSWINQNPWANPNTQEFDQELFSMADRAADQLTLKCYQMGRPDLIQSPEYFNELDNYMGQMMSQREQHGRGEMPMRQVSRNAVTPVRGSNNAYNGGRQKVRLTSEEMDLARNLGVKPEIYVQYKIADAKKRPERWQREQGVSHL